jgi:hypothetical protein
MCFFSVFYSETVKKRVFGIYFLSLYELCGIHSQVAITSSLDTEAEAAIQ